MIAELGANEHINERINQTVRVRQSVRHHFYDVHNVTVWKC